MEQQNNIICNSGDKQNPPLDEVVKNDIYQNEVNVNINNSKDNKENIKSIDNNNIDKINNNLNNITDNVKENNIVPVIINNNNDLNNNNSSNRYSINNVNNAIGYTPQNNNYPQINNFNPQQINQELSCEEKYPNCFWKTKVLFFYNCCDNSEENKIKQENASIYDCFFLLTIFYYILFIISEILLFIFILLKYAFECLVCCCKEFDKAWTEAQKEAKLKEKERERERELQLYNINNQIKDLDRRHENMDRRIFLGNPLNSPDYQQRVIDYQDRKYLEAREELERERKKIFN